MNLCNCDLVLGGGGEEGETPGDGAEDVGGQGRHHQVLLHLQVSGEVRGRGGEGGGQGVLGVDGGTLVLGVHQFSPDQLIGDVLYLIVIRLCLCCVCYYQFNVYLSLCLWKQFKAFLWFCMSTRSVNLGKSFNILDI